MYGCQHTEIQGVYHARGKHQVWSRRLGMRKDELDDEICQKTGLLQLYKRPNPDSASAAFLILSYPRPNTDQHLGAHRADGLFNRIRDRRVKTQWKACQKRLESGRQKPVPEGKDTQVKRLILWTWGPFRDKYAPELEPQSLLKPGQQQDPTPTATPLCQGAPQAMRARSPRSSARTLTSEGARCFPRERLDQDKVQQASTGASGTWPGSRSAEPPGTGERTMGRGGAPGRSPRSLAHPQPAASSPAKSCRGTLPHLSEQANMTTICPKGFLVPWQHTKHELLPPFSGEICKARGCLVGRRAPPCCRNNAGRCRSCYCRTPGNCQNSRN